MNGFIEIKPAGGGGRRLVNIRHIEEIIENADGACTIYLAFICPDAVEQDYIDTNYSFEQMVDMIRRADNEQSN